MSQIKWAIIGAVLVVIVLAALSIGCYFEGRRVERAANQQQLEAAKLEYAADRKQLEQALGDVKNGAGRITAGLAGAIDLAAAAADRNVRIAYLIDGIDSALRQLGVLTDQ